MTHGAVGLSGVAGLAGSAGFTAFVDTGHGEAVNLEGDVAEEGGSVLRGDEVEVLVSDAVAEVGEEVAHHPAGDFDVGFAEPGVVGEGVAHDHLAVVGAAAAADGEGGALEAVGGFEGAAVGPAREVGDGVGGELVEGNEGAAVGGVVLAEAGGAVGGDDDFACAACAGVAPADTGDEGLDFLTHLDEVEAALAGGEKGVDEDAGGLLGGALVGAAAVGEGVEVGADAEAVRAEIVEEVGEGCLEPVGGLLSNRGGDADATAVALGPGVALDGAVEAALPAGQDAVAVVYLAGAVDGGEDEDVVGGEELGGLVVDGGGVGLDHDAGVVAAGAGADSADDGEGGVGNDERLAAEEDDGALLVLGDGSDEAIDGGAGLLGGEAEAFLVSLLADDAAVVAAELAVQGRHDIEGVEVGGGGGGPECLREQRSRWRVEEEVAQVVPEGVRAGFAGEDGFGLAAEFGGADGLLHGVGSIENGAGGI